MSFLDYFRDFFHSNRPRNRRPADQETDNFRNPIWENEEDDSDELDDFRHSRGNFNFRVFSDPLEMTRFFEAEMDNMLKSFFRGFQGQDLFSMPSLPDSAIPAIEPPDSRKRNLRDQVLKPEYDGAVKGSTEKRDTDLDGQISTDSLVKFWGQEPERKPQATFSFRSSMKEFIRKPDGSVEEKEVYTDNDGNQRTVITRLIGDKKYTTTTERSKTGEEIRREVVEDVDRNQLIPSKRNATGDEALDRSWWRTILGLNPKL